MWTENIKLKYFAFCLLGYFQIVAGQRMPEENFLHGLAMLQQESYDSALISFTISKGLNEKDANTWYYSGMTYFKLNNNQEALENFQEAEKLNPGMASLMLAKTYARSLNVPKSLEYLDLHLKSKDKKPESEILTDPDFQKIEDRKEWIDFWKESRYYTPFDELLAEAKYLAKSEDYTEAINLLSGGIKRGYRPSPLLAERAVIYRATGNDQLALKDLNDAIEKDKRNPELYKMRGDLNFKLENYQQAIADYTAALNYRPEELNLYLRRARAYGKNKSIDEAKKDMELYIKFFPQAGEAWYEYGRINMESKKYLDALRCLNRAISLDQTNASYYVARGESYYQTNTLKYASNDLSMSLDLDPTNAEAYYLKGLTALKMGNLEMACFAFKRAFQYGKKEAFNYIQENCQ